MPYTNKILLNLKEALKPAKKATSFDYRGSSKTAIDYFSTSIKQGAKWYPFGESDSTPQYLEYLSQSSAIHGAILQTKQAMISGDGFLINNSKTLEESLSVLKMLPSELQAEYKHLNQNPYEEYELQDLTDELADNYSLTGAFAYLVKWNQDFTKIAAYKPIHIKYLREAVPDKYEEDVKKYYYFEGNWAKARVSDFETYYGYDRKDRDHYEQLVYEKDGYNPIYGVPSYKGAFDWINIDIELGVFHKSNIENGLAPGLHFKFYTVPESEEEKQVIINQIKKNWMGAMNAGRFVPTFSASKELATDVVPIETSGLDKQLLNLTELSDRKILSAHQLPSPLLAGISTAGQLGSNVELPTAFMLWNNLVIKKMRQRIENSLQKHVFDVNLPGIKIDINPFNPIQDLLNSDVKKIG